MNRASDLVAQKPQPLGEPSVVRDTNRDRAVASPARGRLIRLFGRRARDADREDLRRLVQRLYLYMEDGSGGGSWLFTSPGDAEVAVAGVLRLARYLAEDPDRRVLLVDTCLRRRDLTRRLGDERAPGLLDYLAGAQPSWTALVRTVGEKGLSYLPAGSAAGDVHALLRGDGSRISTLLDEAKRDYGFVLVAAPSLLLSTYSLALPALVDGVLVLVKPGETQRQETVACRRVLDTCRARRVGLVIAER